MRPQKLNFETVSDIPITGTAGPSETKLRRRSVKFKWLGVMNQSELQKFIKETGSFPA